MNCGRGSTVLNGIRFGWRLAGFGSLVAGALIEYAAGLALAGRQQDWNARARWLSRLSSRILRLLGVQVRTEGYPPRSGLLVSNHLSYLDILVLASLQPGFFVAKADVARWPLFGLLAGLGGTLFVRRDRRTEVGKSNEALARRLGCGTPVVLFPEGTSSDGRSVLPFRSALLASVTATQTPATPAWIGYHLERGVAEDEVCYWRDMVFLPHFLHLLSLPVIHAAVVFGQPLSGFQDRKALAAVLHDQVADLGLRGRALLAQKTAAKL